MSFSDSIDIASAGMSAQRQRLSIIAANLANSKTTQTPEGGPYRKKMVVFQANTIERDISNSFDDEFHKELRSVGVDGTFEDPSPPNLVFEPSHPDANAEGFVAYPNINPVDEMVNMMGASRSYEANLEVLKTVKRLSNAALELSRA
jgi:flagellar basal-body rod protein FlgC